LVYTAESVPVLHHCMFPTSIKCAWQLWYKAWNTLLHKLSMRGHHTPVCTCPSFWTHRNMLSPLILVFFTNASFNHNGTAQDCSQSRNMHKTVVARLWEVSQTLVVCWEQDVSQKYCDLEVSSV
jgi:hypothetical protein